MTKYENFNLGSLKHLEPASLIYSLSVRDYIDDNCDHLWETIILCAWAHAVQFDTIKDIPSKVMVDQQHSCYVIYYKKDEYHLYFEEVFERLWSNYENEQYEMYNMHPEQEDICHNIQYLEFDTSDGCTENIVMLKNPKMFL